MASRYHFGQHSFILCINLWWLLIILKNLNVICEKLRASPCRTLNARLGRLIYPESDESHGRVWTGKGHNQTCVLERSLAVVKRGRRGGRDQWQGWASSQASGGQSSGDARGVINEELTRRWISGLFGIKNQQDLGRLDVHVRETEQVSWFGFSLEPTLRHGFKCK